MEKETPWVVPEDGELDFFGVYGKRCEVRQMRLLTFWPGWVSWGSKAGDVGESAT